MNKKTLVTIVLTLVIAFLPITTTINNNVNAATNDDEIVNLALNATVTTSSNENDSLLGQYAVDGDSSTRWSSAWNDGEWIMVDLGTICTVGCVNIEWEDAYASTYTIMWSQDNVTWYTASTSTIHSSAKTTNMFYNRPVRYIKVVCDKRATIYGSSIYELEVMGSKPSTEVETTTEEVVTPTTNLALGKNVVSSSNEDNSLIAANAVDGDVSTRWSSAWRDGEWIMIDLGKLYNVSYLTIDWEAAFASKYTVSWSQDNVTWNDALTFGTSVAASQTHMMYNRPLRYIKITANTRGTSYGASIYEIGVFGSTYDPNYVYRK